MLIATLLASAILPGCSRPPLTKDLAQGLIQDLPDFQPHQVKVRLTADEIKRGADAGYWILVEMNKTNSQLPSMQMLTLTPSGRLNFHGTSVPVFNPLVSINQELGARLIEVQDIQDSSQDPKEKVATYTWTRRYDALPSDVAEIFKEHPLETSKQTFRYGKSGWEVKP